MLRRLGFDGASGAFLASLAIALSSGLAPGAAAEGTITGASQATCTPSPCVSPEGFTQYTLQEVPNGDGTTSSREYAVERPGNLAPSPTNLAPAVVAFYEGGNCGLNGLPAGRFGSLAAENKFIVVYMEVPCARGDYNWDKRNVDPTTSTAVNDEPYVTAVVRAITQCPSTGAQPGQCVDPRRIYAAGTSSGANMTADVMCDAENSTLFRGYLIDSSSLQLFEGAPACPSRNRSFFVMMALSNYGIDGGLYYDTAPSPHLDVPLFADWAASRLGCESRRVDDAIGSPVASTLRYVYSGPCAYAVAGSQAVVTLGVQNGGHTWHCQDSDAAAPTPYCPAIPDPPGLQPNGLPYTNGLFVEEDFWNFVAQGVSTEANAPELSQPIPPGATAGATGASGSILPGGGSPIGDTPFTTPSSFVALGDAYSSGESNFPYLPGTDTAHNRCHRSTISYPFMASARLSGGPSGLTFRACSGAKIADFYGSDGRDREPPQLRWIDGATRLVSVSVGWDDALLPELLRSCVLDASRCERRWRARARAAIGAIGAHSPRSRNSLYALFGKIASLAPKARVVVFGYPRLFAALPPARCSTGIPSLSFTRASMEWIDSDIRRLDDAIENAAGAAHVRYVSGSFGAFRRHERCMRQPDVNGALTTGRARARGLLDGSFGPNRRGERALTTLLERAAA